jgi:hypothetical protein
LSREHVVFRGQLNRKSTKSGLKSHKETGIPIALLRRRRRS